MLFTVANFITVFRLFLFLVFVWYLASGNVSAAIWFFIAAWALDAVDGFIARALKQDSAFGSMLDKIVDRLIMLLSVAFLIRLEYLPDIAIWILTKDAALAPALTIKPRGQQQEKFTIGVLGKIATFLQGASVLWLFFGFPFQLGIVSITAAFGAFVAFRHLKKLAYK